MNARRLTILIILGMAAIPVLSSCGQKPNHRVQGYGEGEFIYIASPFPGRLESLNVQKGLEVKKGETLFTLESTSEKALLDEAEERLRQARANLEDLKKGKRPTEIKSLESQLEEARAALALSEKEFARHEELLLSGVASRQEFDRASSLRDQNRKKVAQLEADLETARLGARSDLVAAAEANVKAQEASVAKARWALSQKSQTAPSSGLIFDTLYREGEWVAADRPVVMLLPPENIRVRAFVTEGDLGRIRLGAQARVSVDGVKEPYVGKVSFISPRAEYTPPVIYSRESREKLTFMVEVTFDPKTAANLHPGQPVDVEFKS